MNVRAILALFTVVVALSPARGQDDLVSQARKLIAAGKTVEAVTLLEDNYDKIKGNGEALLILADESVKSQQYGKAMDYSLRALEVGGESYEANRLAGLAFYNRALEAASNPRATGGQVQGLFEEAGQFLGAALKVDPNHADVWGLKGECLWRANDPDAAAQAAKDYLKAAALEPKQIKWYTGAVRAFQLAKDTAGALKCVTDSLRKIPGSSELLLLRGDIQRLSDPAKLDEAIASYREALKAPDLAAPFDATAANHIWGLLGAKKRMDEALAAVTDWKTAHPRNFNAFWWAGYYAFQLSQYDAALVDFTKAFEVSGKSHAGTAVWVGDCHAKKNELKKAGEWMVRASKIPATWQDPNQAPINKILAIARGSFLEKQLLEEGIKYLETYGTKIAPDQVWLLNNLGLAWRDLSERKRGKAREYSKKSLGYYKRACKAILTDETATPSNKAMVFNDTGLLYHFPRYKINDVMEAVKLYRKALAFDPEYIDALENLGLCMNMLGKYEEAMPLFEKVLARQPGRRVSLRGSEVAKDGLKK